FRLTPDPQFDADSLRLKMCQAVVLGAMRKAAPRRQPGENTIEPHCDDLPVLAWLHTHLTAGV
ncbi:MAG: hypothetical protein WAK55_33700, partial [Xanthobacteraceae bacterium]